MENVRFHVATVGLDLYSKTASGSVHTRLPPAGSAVALAETPAPHIWRENTSGMPVCRTTELKKGSTDGSGWEEKKTHSSYLKEALNIFRSYNTNGLNRN